MLACRLDDPRIRRRR